MGTKLDIEWCYFFNSSVLVDYKSNLTPLNARDALANYIYTVVIL